MKLFPTALRGTSITTALQGTTKDRVEDGDADALHSTASLHLHCWGLFYLEGSFKTQFPYYHNFTGPVTLSSFHFPSPKASTYLSVLYFPLSFLFI